MKEILKVKDVMKVYPNGVMACKDINFSALKGEIHAICGENGAGKSTLMKMLYGSPSICRTLPLSSSISRSRPSRLTSRF